MKIKEWYDKIPNQFKSKYTLVALFFLIWMTFFDMARFSVLGKKTSEKERLRDIRDSLQSQIDKNYQTLELLEDSTYLDNFARDKYMMKREDEDLFVIVDSTKVEEE